MDIQPGKGLLFRALFLGGLFPAGLFHALDRPFFLLHQYNVDVDPDRDFPQPLDDLSQPGYCVLAQSPGLGVFPSSFGNSLPDRTQPIIEFTELGRACVPYQFTATSCSTPDPSSYLTYPCFRPNSCRHFVTFTS